jgi:ADP-heptose:LPS heptosyltransferase/GT2 family glycosyltransferase
VQIFCDLIELTTGGRCVVSGWAVGAVATERISVLLDGEEIGEAEIGVERPDVGNRFPALIHARRAGFSFRHGLSAVSEGEHLVILRHRAADEETDILLPVLAVPGSGLDAAKTTSASATGELLLNIDLPKLVDGAVATPIRNNLEIAGWALARRGVTSIDIAIDGERIKSAHTGIRRLDVQLAFPNWDGAITAGFSALLPHRTLPKGKHTIAVALRDRSGEVSRSEFRIEVEDAPDTDGPWSLRRRMSPAEIDLLSRPLLGISQRPSFGILLPLPQGDKALDQARVTLASLGTQAYENWRLFILARTRRSETWRSALLDGFEALADRVELLSGDRAVGGLLAASSAVSHLLVLGPGDELGCDALLEFAVQAALHPESNFLYSDERRLNPSSGKVEAFFKPQWSPDLLLSMNYLGRAWCASTDLLRRAAIRPAELVSAGSYHLALRLTEHAAAIRHVPATLLQAAAVAKDDTAERKALQNALARRGITAAVQPGRTGGTFRVRRKVAAQGLVSIIIPTCAARGLIKTCIDTLRGLTAYRNFKIVCIENIPADKPELKAWLRANADTVIETTEPFNWSRFNNLAVAASRGEFLLFLNDDIEIIDPAWLEALLEQAQRPEVGAVGPQLLYPDRRVQHAGMFLANIGVARHAFRHAAEDDPGYFGLALSQRDVMAVTGACLMTRRETFELLGRFNETHDIVNNDLGYCLRVWRHGLRTVYTPHTRLIHHELASRADLTDSYDAAAFEIEWRNLFVAGDPFYHPRLAKDRDDYSIEWEPVEVLCAGHPVLPRESIRRILIVKLDHIGDCVTALPAIRRLKRHFPAVRISVLTGRASKAVWGLEPAVDEIIEFDFFHARSSSGLVERTEQDWRELSERLAPLRFDLAIDLRMHWETRPVLQYTGARYLAGFDMKGRFPWLDVAIEWSEDVALIRKRQQTTDALVNLVDAIAAASEADRTVFSQLPSPLADAALAKVPKARLIFRKRVVCVHPSVGNEMRQWPLEYFSLLVDQLIETENVHVILIGGPDEAALGAKVLEAITHPKSVWSLIGSVKLGDLPALIARCALFVGNNSGPQHIAAGLGVPTVGIHSGVVDAREWGPMGTTACAIHRAMTCAPCYHLKLEDCGRGLACLRGLLPADVVRVCQRLLATSPSKSNDAWPRRHGTEQIAKHA